MIVSVTVIADDGKEYALAARRTDFRHDGAFLRAVECLGKMLLTRTLMSMDLPISFSDVLERYKPQV